MLSDDQKKPISKLPGSPLPGLGGNPNVGPLPGLGGKPIGGLPGMGARPGAGGLPGMKPLGGALPGMKPGAALTPSSAPMPMPGQAPAVSPFLQQKHPQIDTAQQQAEEARAAAMAAEQRIIDALVQTSKQGSPAMDKRSKKTIMYASIATAVIGIGVGMAFGMGLSARQQLNIAIRDAFVIDYELKGAAKLFNEVEAVLNTALAKANKHEFDESHLAFLKANVTGNPLKPEILTDRNYKSFNPTAVGLLLDYYKRGDKLYQLIREHLRYTENDRKQLKASGPAAQKLAETTYGVVFKRDKDLGGKFVANVVVLGAMEGNTVQVQLDTSAFTAERELYNPESEDTALTKEPTKYVVEVAPESKENLLANATQSHFKKYLLRLQEMSNLMTGLDQVQKDLLDMISRICSQDPSWGVGPNPEKSFEEYIQRSKASGDSAK